MDNTVTLDAPLQIPPSGLALQPAAPSLCLLDSQGFHKPTSVFQASPVQSLVCFCS